MRTGSMRMKADALASSEVCACRLTSTTQWEGSCGLGTQGRGSLMREGDGPRQLEATVVICGALEEGATIELGLGGWVPRGSLCATLEKVHGGYHAACVTRYRFCLSDCPGRV